MFVDVKEKILFCRVRRISYKNVDWLEKEVVDVREIIATEEN